MSEFMVEWLIVGSVFVVLWVCWSALGALFDWISEQQHGIHSSPRNNGGELGSERGD